MDEVSRLVARFYDEVWNRWDDAALVEVLDPDLRFRGSLGDEVRGHAGFRAYRDRVRRAAPDFRNRIVDLVAAPDRAAVRILCRGHHHGELVGVPASGRAFEYAAAAFLRIAGGRLTEAWVLGDLASLRRQLTGGVAGAAE